MACSALLALVSCGADLPDAPAFVQVSDRIFCGGEPTVETFKALNEIGVRTIVSVDGSAPQVEMAAKFGLRYVHIPIGYEGVSGRESLSLTRVVRDFRGRIYIHCHHGKHRGPAATAIACRADGTADESRAIQILEDAGTSRDYVGLWESVRSFCVPAVSVRLPELAATAEPKEMAVAMSELGRHFDDLEASFVGTLTEPNTVSSSLLVREDLSEAFRLLESGNVVGVEPGFADLLRESVALSTSFHESLRGTCHSDVSNRFAALKRCCVNCHNRYRDSPSAVRSLLP